MRIDRGSGKFFGIGYRWSATRLRRLQVKRSTRRTFGTAALAVCAAALIVAAGAAAFVWSGVYDVSVTTQHFQAVYRLLEFATQQSVRRHARAGPAPPPDLAQQVARGAVCYRAKCLQCHGAAGIAPGDVGLAMQPLPGPLIDAAARFDARELHWIVRHGLKMSGMPAWRYRLGDADQWAVVAFVQALPDLDPQAQQALLAGSTAGTCEGPAESAPGAGDAQRGQRALHLHACSSCHVIPGVVGADVHAGPPLRGMGRRGLIAGKLAHTPEQMVRWLRDPKSVDPLTAMPAVGIGEQDARDMAAYLATLD